MKLICSIATIIERSKARYCITTHICSPWRCSWSRHKSQDMSQDATSLQFYTVVRRARGARTDTLKIENYKTHTELSKQSNFSSPHSSFTRCYIATSDP